MKKLYDKAVNISFVKKLMQKPFFAKLLSYEVLLYIFFGVVTTIINYGLFTILSLLIGDEPVIDYKLLGFSFQISWGTLISNFISWAITVFVAFVTNKIFVFESKSWAKNILGKELGSFIGARIFSLIVEQAGLFVLVDLLGIKKMISKAMLAVIVVIMNYFFSKFLIFTKRKKE